MMWFTLLGRVRILGRLGDCLAASGPRTRALAARLMSRRGEHVSADELVDWLWGDDPPASRNALHAQMHRLRSALAADESVAARLTSGRSSYRLMVEDDELDLARFRTLRESGRSSLADGLPEAAAPMFRAALELWTGRPLDGATLACPAAHALVRGLEEERSGVVELMIDAELDAGRGGELVGELTTLVAENPLRERFHGQLMLALAAAGRRAEALAAFLRARRVLIEHGVEPGAELKAVQARLLSQPSAAALPAPTVLRPVPRRGELPAGAGTPQARSVPRGPTEERSAGGSSSGGGAPGDGVAPEVAEASAAGRPRGVPDALELFPVAIGRYSDPGWAVLDVDAEAGWLQDVLARYGSHLRPWSVPPGERGAAAVARRLRGWATAEAPPATGSILYWSGHGWTEGSRAALAHADSPVRVAESGIGPEHLADAIRTRQARRPGTGWVLVVVEAGHARRFVELLASALKAVDPPRQVLLVGVGADDEAPLGRFAAALRSGLADSAAPDGRVPLLDLVTRFHRLLPGCEISLLGDLSDAELTPLPATEGDWSAQPLGAVRPLEEVLAGLTADERSHFLLKAQGCEPGDLSWFFEGRAAERQHVVAWLRGVDEGLLVVTGPAGAGKSALLGNVLIGSLPDVRRALERRGLTRHAPPPLPPDHVFDAAIHLSGLTLAQVTSRVAAGAGLGPVPSATDPDVGIATDLDWLAAALAARTRPFTVLADALDEAAEPLDVARSLLARIAAVPGVRVVVGTRASTEDEPDRPDTSATEDLIEALAGDGGAGRDTGVLRLGPEPRAVTRYVIHRLRAARDQGAPGVPLENWRIVQQWRDDDIERVAAVVAGRGKGFLYARLAVHEVIAEPRLLTPQRARTLRALLEGDHRDLFAKAVERLTHLDDRYPVLMQALALAYGRGLPAADGVWAAVAAALAPTGDHAVGWDGAVAPLLEDAAAYIVSDAGELSPDGAGAVASPGPVVYRFAHQIFVDYFATGPGAGRSPDHRRTVTGALLDAAARRTSSGQPMSSYLVQHLSAHVAETGEWDALAARPAVLDALDPRAVTADALRTAFGRRPLPAAVAGVIGGRDLLAAAGPADRAGLRQLAMTVHGPYPVIAEPTAGWGVVAARVGRSVPHIRLAGHTAAVAAARPVDLPGGRRALATASDDGTIRLWDPHSAAPIGAPLIGHEGSVEDIEVVPAAPDGATWLVSAGGDGTVRLWDLVAGRQVGEPLTDRAGAVWAVCALPPPGTAGGRPEGSRLVAAASSDGTIRVWDVVSGRPFGEPLTGHEGTVNGLCAVPGWDAGGRPDGRVLLASSGGDGTVRVWDPVAGTPVGEPFRGHAGAVLRVCAVRLPDAEACPGGRVLMASSGLDGSVRVWDPAAATAFGPPLTGHTGSVYGVCTVPGRRADGMPGAGVLLASAGADGAVRLWDPLSGHAVGEPLTGHTGGVYGLCAVPDWDLDGPAGQDGAGPPPTGRALLASTGFDGTVRIWDPWTGGEAGADHGSPGGGVHGVRVLPPVDGAVDGPVLVAAAGGDGSVRLWDPVCGRQMTPPLAGHAGDAYAACPLPGWGGRASHADAVGAGVLVTAGLDGMLRIWDRSSGGPVGDPVSAHPRGVTCLELMPGPDGAPRLVSGGLDGALRVWDPATGAPVGAALTGHTDGVLGLCPLPASGTRPPLLASAAGDGTVRLWDLERGCQVGPALVGHTGSVNGVCTFSVPAVGGDPEGDDGRDPTEPVGADARRAATDVAARVLLASAGYDGTVRIWDPATGAQWGDPLTGHVGGVWGVCAVPSPDGRGRSLLATAGADGTLRLWDPRSRQQVREPLAVANGSVWSLAALPGTHRSDGRPLVVTGSFDGSVHLWDVFAGLPFGGVLAGAAECVEALTPLRPAGPGRSGPDGCLVLSGDGVVRVWNPSTAALVPWPAAVPMPVTAVAVLPGSGPEAASAGSGGAGAGEMLRAGLPLAGDAAGRLHVLNLREQGLASGGSLRVDDGPVLVLRRLPDGGRTAVAGRSGIVTVFTADGRQELAFRASSATVRDLCTLWTGAGSPLLAVAADDGVVGLWRPDDGTAHGPPLLGHLGRVWALTALPRPDGPGSLLATAGADGTVRLWDPDTGSPWGAPLTGHDGQVRTVATIVAGDRILLLSGGVDGTVRLWEPGTGCGIHSVPLGLPVHALLPGTEERGGAPGVRVTAGLRTGVVELTIGPALLSCGGVRDPGRGAAPSRTGTSGRRAGAGDQAIGMTGC